ncbi:MAG: hypothetical protein P8181_16165 [bacterium]
MSRQKLSIMRSLLLFAVLGSLAVLLTQCSDDPVAPDPAEIIAIDSGDQQYSMRGTTLPAPLIVRVRTAQHRIPEEAYVVFKVLAGDGSLSRTTARVNTKGLASTEYTLGPELGTNIISATLQENTSKSVQFQATSANFFCPEQEDTFRVTYPQVPSPPGGICTSPGLHWTAKSSRSIPMGTSHSLHVSNRTSPNRTRPWRSKRTQAVS